MLFSTVPKPQRLRFGHFPYSFGHLPGRNLIVTLDLRQRYNVIKSLSRGSYDHMICMGTHNMCILVFLVPIDIHDFCKYPTNLCILKMQLRLTSDILYCITIVYHV